MVHKLQRARENPPLHHRFNSFPKQIDFQNKAFTDSSQFSYEKNLTPKVKESKCIIESIIHFILRSILLHSLKYHSDVA